MSERDGDYHLYVTDVDGGATTQLTRGAFELTDLRMSADRTRWHFISNEVHPGEHQLYSMPLEGGARTRLTQNSGWYTYVLSPDERHVALTYSNQTSPGDLFVMASQSNFEVSAEPTQLTDSIKEEFRRHAWQANEIVTFDDGEGHTIYADLFVPDRVHPARPAVIYVHGAGWAQGVSRRWSGMRPFLHYLVQEGYIVMSVDYRGSRGYGRDFRTGIYRHMGETEIKSGLAAVEYLVRELNVDRSRIGLFGGSYGGFYTLMAMFKHPGVFAAGAVRAPVTDWAHYNHGYTTRILNSPYNDTMAYERSSPIYFADGLQDHLLIQHGVQDDNVHFQDSVRLAQRLLELKKENWEIMIYPIEAHSLRGEEGEFNWSSQHLDDEVLRCRDGNGDGQTGRVGLRCVRLVGRRQRGVRSSNGSGRRSRGGCRVRMPLCPVACRRPWVVVGSVRAVVCRRSAWRPDRLATCPLRSGKRSRSCELRAPGCVTLPVGSGEPRRLSRESCVATRRLEAAVWRIGRRLRSGTAPDVPSARRSPSWPRTIG